MLRQGFHKLRLVWHILYWVLATVFLYYFLGFQVGTEFSGWFVLMLTPVTISTTYFFTHYLIPVYLNKKRYSGFILYASYTIILSVYLTLVVVFVIFIFIADLNVQLAYFNATFLLIGIYIPVIAGIAIRLYRILRVSEEKNLKLLQQKTEAELKFLKSQIEPHFLFNTLNNIYSLTLDKSDKAPQVVLQLSGLLSYIIYDCSHSTVSLGKEIEQLENYISLEQLRYDNRVKVIRTIQAGLEDIMIMPLIFLPLMENCFKHGVKSSARESWIRLSVELKNTKLLVQIANSIPVKPDKKRGKGIGLENLQNRLSGFYGNNYHLELKTGESDFSVFLEITVSK